MEQYTYIGPIRQLLTFSKLSNRGPLKDVDLPLLENAGILFKDGIIHSIGTHKQLISVAEKQGAEILELDSPVVGLPSYVDAHTHICFSGSRAGDYAARNSGSSYQEIALSGGGIWQTVTDTRKATIDHLVAGIVSRTEEHIRNGVTTIEVKSGYGLSIDEELKMLKAIQKANKKVKADLIPTFLGAHLLPKDFNGDGQAYLNLLANDLLPKIKEDHLAGRVDIFIEAGAFNPEQGRSYLTKAKTMGFDLTVHADQFTVGGSALAIEMGALSADHLEASGPAEIKALAKSGVTGIALPGASMGLGCPFTPARALLDEGGALAIASDHNPGSAPMGQLLTQAAVLGSYEKLSNAEVFSGITFRAGNALGLSDRGQIAAGQLGDMLLYNTDDYREILYHQGSLKPMTVLKEGKVIFNDKTREPHASR